VLVTRIPALIFGGIMDIGVYTSLGNLLLGNGNLPERDERKMIFSPFGLGVFDLSVANLGLKKISKDGGGTLVESLLS
jgi:ornithine cyclodeaminase/alanine dehydrogenase-like protein (mu-crystallin family)